MIVGKHLLLPTTEEYTFIYHDGRHVVSDFGHHCVSCGLVVLTAALL